jgi:hypothetical protein
MVVVGGAGRRASPLSTSPQLLRARLLARLVLQCAGVWAIAIDRVKTAASPFTKQTGRQGASNRPAAERHREWLSRSSLRRQLLSELATAVGRDVPGIGVGGVRHGIPLRPARPDDDQPRARFPRNPPRLSQVRQLPCPTWPVSPASTIGPSSRRRSTRIASSPWPSSGAGTTTWASRRFRSDRSGPSRRRGVPRSKLHTEHP